jgi:hypothetical protein
MRDGHWKLVRPAIAELMKVSSEDLAMDIQSIYNPEKFHDILRTPNPERVKPKPPPAQLFDIATDPSEQNDQAPTETERVSRMTNALTKWFEEVDQDRRTIPD